MIENTDVKTPLQKPRRRLKDYTKIILKEIRCISVDLTLRLLISYIDAAPSKARNANVVYIWT